MEMSTFNPYAGNLLVERLRPILPPEEMATLLTYLPEVPSDVAAIPRYMRIHYLRSLREFHVATREEMKLSVTVDLMLRDNLSRQDPTMPGTWSSLRQEGYGSRPRPPALAAILTGLPGTGKTSATRNVLHTYDPIVVHQAFPGIARPLKQVVWMSCDIPASGRSDDLAASLMREWDRVSETNRFEHVLERRPKGRVMLDEWQQVASAHFLGLLHLDEVQNLFRLAALEKRRRVKSDNEEVQLSIVEDECLKSILNMYNSGRFALLCSGTPDGMTALSKRVATTERLTTGGAHHFTNFKDAKERDFRKLFLPQLMRYQYVAKPIGLSDEFAELLIDLSGGILRIIIALWISAHRIAFERKDTDELRPADFKLASDTYLAPLKPAIAAIRSQDPKQICRFGDLVNLGDDFWASLWT